MLTQFTQMFEQGMTGFKRFTEIMDQNPDIIDLPDAVALGQVDGSISFEDVTFSYDDQEHVLRSVDLEIPAGKTLALVGPSGAGKSTLCNLIPRFYEINSGAIIIDGTNIRNIQLASLRGNIGIVQQDVYLFPGTVMDNIRYGNVEACEEAIIAAAKKANAHEFIMALPQGYNTDIGQRGVKLSGGQQQRVSIARVFLKNPPILIFDEATSALDNESEKAIQDSVEALTQNRTTIVIAHRLSTVRNAQRIVVLNDGQIVEQGSHDALIASNGTYANLYNMQSRI